MSNLTTDRISSQSFHHNKRLLPTSSISSTPDRQIPPSSRISRKIIHYKDLDDPSAEEDKDPWGNFAKTWSKKETNKFKDIQELLKEQGTT